MNRWLLLRHLDWPRFLSVFFFADVAGLVVPAWALALRLTGTPEDSSGLENLRHLAADAHQELRQLLSDATERAARDSSRPERP